jgi:hypothetical protein
MEKGIDPRQIRMIKGDDLSVLRGLPSVEKSVDESSYQKGEP